MVLLGRGYTLGGVGALALSGSIDGFANFIFGFGQAHPGLLLQILDQLD